MEACWQLLDTVETNSNIRCSKSVAGRRLNAEDATCVLFPIFSVYNIEIAIDTCSQVIVTLWIIIVYIMDYGAVHLLHTHKKKQGGSTPPTPPSNQTPL